MVASALDRLLAMFSAAPVVDPDPPGDRHARACVAVAALLLEASQIDRETSAEERAAVLRVLRERFGMSEEDARDIVALAEDELAEALEDWVFAEAVRTRFDAAEREVVVGMLWEVVYADGALRGLEDRLVHRLGEALDVPLERVERVRAEAFARVGLGRPSDNWSPPR